MPDVSVCVCADFGKKLPLLKPWRKVTTTTVPTPRKLTYAEKCSSESVFFDRGRQMNNREQMVKMGARVGGLQNGLKHIPPV